VDDFIAAWTFLEKALRNVAFFATDIAKRGFFKNSHLKRARR